MTHRSRPPRLRLFGMLFVGCVVAVAVVAGCGSGGPSASFDPAAGCPSEGRAVGAIPELESRIPTAYEGRGPDDLDSGRHCSAASLGSFAAAGFEEVEFAGGTWDLGGYRATALVVFRAPDLSAEDVMDFYVSSARGANRTQVTGESTPEVAGRPGYRLDTRTADRIQTVVTWPAEDPGIVNVVITNDLPDPKIQAAIDAFGWP